MGTFDAKSPLVRDREEKVQELSIPFLIVHNATPASKVLSTDEPAVLLLQTQGVTQIPASPALVFDLAASDASGAINLEVDLCPGPDATRPSNGDRIFKILKVSVINRITGVSHPAYHNVTNSDVDSTSTRMLLNCASGVNLATTDLNATLHVEYITRR